jgi:hypothetical protein
MAGPLFSNEDWRGLASIASSAFGMDAGRAARLAANPTAKLIAAIPFLAGCREPARTALAHLATFIVASSEAGESIFDHGPGDDYDPLARLATIAGFEGGDPAVIDKGMKVLARMMVEGYKMDVEADREKGQYNPLGSGAWNAEEALASLARGAAAVRDAGMEAILAESAAGAWWSRP